MFLLLKRLGSYTLRQKKRGAWQHRLFAMLLLASGAFAAVPCSSHEGAYGPYHMIGYNYTDRHIFSFWVNDTWGGSSDAHEISGGGGITCCLSIPHAAKTLHMKIVYELTKEQYEKNLPNDRFETDIPVPPLPNKHDGYLEVHFLPKQKIESQWVDFPTKPKIPNVRSAEH
ncbi:DUF3304 domain-containing protein [Paraburkholderia sediminicola]|uniref:DUF3304 domain-containing protein n=1 Tax=Paraburkholderia sediminicola TaxID=458836 RepID=UPI0038BD81AD